MEKKRDRELLDYKIIEKAQLGDADALRSVLDFFSSYINKLSTKMLYDENGIKYSAIDSELKSRLEAKLISKILAFKLNN
ncbi:helix-turn-helix domain-containing protein [Listeria booriae]|uniref:helix-turn-helix domain-containing protein n=1 Tax=Listeria booriae TaxID=1552123 RepID=UPI0016262457|nr:helix-turn-helix domain-containing protein [Listeria booriae]MBC1227604.1 helix-turn-helix domain-containing protein [Listeria booriae]